MNEILVLSYTHSLLPLAWRLRREGAEVRVLVVKKRYQPAWSGKLYKEEVGSFEKGVRDIGPAQWEPWVEQAKAGEIAVVTDTEAALPAFAGSPHLFPTVKGATYGTPGLVLGAWFDQGAWYHPHWFFPEWGAWPGGGGPTVLGGGTVVRPAPIGPWLAGVAGPLSEIGYRGLVGVGLAYAQASGEFQPTGFQAGWAPIHWHLFMEGLESWTALVDGRPTEAQPTSDTYTVGVVVSQPPWPTIGSPSPPQVELSSVTPEVSGSTFFHDIRLKGSVLSTGGTDGLIGITRGSGRTLQRARTRALLTAGAIRFPERQMRTDIASNVDASLAVLEELGLF